MSRDSVLLILLFLVVASTFFSPGQRDLFVGDETKYGQILWEMRAHHALLVPQLEGRPYSHKPPLHFWMVYALTYLFGISSTWAFVLPSLLAFIAMLLLIRKMAVELFGGTGLLAALIFSTFNLAWGLGQTARMDMTFAVLTTAAILHLWRFLTTGQPRNLILVGLLVGIAIMIKGPMSFIIVILLLIIEKVRRRRAGSVPASPRPRVPASLSYIAALVLAAGIPLAWLIPALRAGGEHYAQEIVVEQNLGRAFSSWVHREPPWWYLQRFPATFFPWFFLAIVTIIAIYKTPSEESERRQAERFCMSWFLAVLIPFSAISGKLDVYMLPAMIPIAILGGHFVHSIRESRWTRLATTGNVVIIALVALLGIAVPLAAPLFHAEVPELDVLARSVALLAWSSAGLALGILLALMAFWKRETWQWQQRLFWSTVAVAVVTIFPQIFVITALLPAVNEMVSTRPLVRALRQQSVEGPEVGLWRTPHLWTRDMPESYRRVEFMGSDRLQQPGPKPLVIVTRAERAHHLGPELLEQYRMSCWSARGLLG
jgi:4-amino-4-deoxy-L-arabinose transferase-like glycosyltransferase